MHTHVRMYLYTHRQAVWHTLAVMRNPACDDSIIEFCSPVLLKLTNNVFGHGEKHLLFWREYSVYSRPHSTCKSSSPVQYSTAC